MASSFIELFEWCSYDKYMKRAFSLSVVCIEIFLCGFLWCGMGYACRCGHNSTAFFFATGFGSGMGALVGHLLPQIRIENGFPTVSKQEIFHACAYFCAIFLGSGTTWQRVVNDTFDYGMTFTESFFYVWVISFLLFLTILTLMRLLNTKYSKKQFKEFLNINNDFDTVRERIYYDIQLCISTGLADAFFLGTVVGEYHNNWLGPILAIHDETHELEAMIKSGASTVMGFLISQLLQNAIVKDSWLDEETVVSTTATTTTTSNGTATVLSKTSTDDTYTITNYPTTITATTTVAPSSVVSIAMEHTRNTLLTNTTDCAVDDQIDLQLSSIIPNSV